MAEDLKTTVTHLTTHPGVYQFFDRQGVILYVGKAKNLKKRISSYFSRAAQGNKTKALVSKIHTLQVIITQSETEALLLEQTLIKNLMPPYNILLRDDKSYPYIYLSSQHTYPRLSFYRGSKPKAGELFGPYPSGLAVRQSLQWLQKVFQVRQCEDSFFKNRSRPCLNYQIKRCSGPCVKFISEKDYAESVEHTRLFLRGKSSELIQRLVEKMELAAQSQDYETASVYRDQIIALRRIQESQHVTNQTIDSVDVFAVSIQTVHACVHVLMVRDGRMLGGKNYIFTLQETQETAELLNEFIGQYYLGAQHREVPRYILTQQAIEDAPLLSEALSSTTQHKVQIQHPQRGSKIAWLKMAIKNAEIHLGSQLAAKENTQKRFAALQEALALTELPQRLECFDISHNQGDATYASCVVFNSEGPLKSDYRRYAIKDITPGDDYAAIEQALLRRYAQANQAEMVWPDIIFIDGGKGQLSRAQSVLHELQIEHLLLVGISKGPDRKPGLEKIWLTGKEQPITLPSHLPALHLIQEIRDEAHRFAITGHRQKQNKQHRQSSLEAISGIGPKRRRQLLTHLGGMQELKRASAEDLAKVPGISAKMAEMIYAALHSGSHQTHLHTQSE